MLGRGRSRIIRGREREEVYIFSGMGGSQEIRGFNGYNDVVRADRIRASVDRVGLGYQIGTVQDVNKLGSVLVVLSDITINLCPFTLDVAQRDNTQCPYLPADSPGIPMPDHQVVVHLGTVTFLAVKLVVMSSLVE